MSITEIIRKYHPFAYKQNATESVRKRLIFWAVMLISIIGMASWTGYTTLRDQIMADAHAAADSRLDDVQSDLKITNEIYLTHTHAAMNVLKDQTLAFGLPHLQGTLRIGDEVVPNLAFGTRTVGGNFQIVDKVKALMGGTATLFVHDGDRFIRVSTNVFKSSGERAVGTILDPQGAAIQAIHHGSSFTGVVGILGRSYITEYDPIYDQAGLLIGIWYVGYPIESLQQLLGQVEKMQILDHGFVMLVDNEHHVVAHSVKYEPGVISSVLNVSNPSDPKTSMRDWQLQRETFEPWNYTIISATYIPDVFWRTSKVVGIVLIVTSFLTFCALSAQGAALLRSRELHLEAEKARMAAEEVSRTKSSFLANMSHELRTPLNAIIGYSDMLLEDQTGTVKEISPDLEKIRGAGKHLLGLVNDILDLSKIEAGKMTLYFENIDLAQMLRDITSTIAPLIEKNGNVLELDYPENELGSFSGDLTKTKQILLNLLSNASKFTTKGRVQLSVKLAENQILFRVADSGIGMTPEQQSRLFQKFSQGDDTTTRRFGGTGLGLAISKHFCEMMGGKIEVESTIGVGSTFTLSLPRYRNGASQVGDFTTMQVLKKLTGPLPGKRLEEPSRVLVVDQDATLREKMKATLEHENYVVKTASSGAEALRMCPQFRPDLITLNVEMPGLDGWSVLSRLKTNPETTSIPVIMVTVIDGKPLGYSLGADDYVVDPFDRDHLIKILSANRPKNAVPTILIVDDDPTVYDLASRSLQSAGFKTIQAPNGVEGLKQVAENRPDLIVLDLMMPEMNGIDFMIELKNREANSPHPTPVVVYSSKDLSEEDRKVLNRSVEDILSKGDKTAGDLVVLVKKHLDSGNLRA